MEVMILDITQLLDICISDKLIDMVISGQKNKSEDKAVKVRIRPVILKNEIEYQVSEFVGRKVLHSNHSAADVKKKIIDYMTEDFKQAQINMTDAAATILSSKSKTLTCKYKKAGQLKVQRDLSHNRTKKYIIQEGKPVAFMIDLGVMGQDGKIIRTRYDKFRQINRFLEFIEDILPQLDKDKEQTIIDFGCGKGRLNFYLNYNYNCNVLGIEMDENFYNQCMENKKEYLKNNKREEEKINFLCTLAQEYEISDKNNKFYFFNPFSVHIFMKVVENILISFENNPRKIDIILYYPSDDYIYYLENCTPFMQIEEVRLDDLYKKDNQERFLIYELSYY